MSLQTSAIHRSLGQLAVKVQSASDRRKAEALAEGLAEVDQQYQVEISGQVGGLVWLTVKLDFDEFFVDAPSQRDADLDEPHFTYGSVIDEGPPLIIDAHVSDWHTDAQGNVTGATVRVGVWNPLETGQDPTAFPKFSGRVHLNFQGFAAPNDPSDEDD